MTDQGNLQKTVSIWGLWFQSVSLWQGAWQQAVNRVLEPQLRTHIRIHEHEEARRVWEAVTVLQRYHTGLVLSERLACVLCVCTDQLPRLKVCKALFGYKLGASEACFWQWSQASHGSGSELIEQRCSAHSLPKQGGFRT